MLSRLAALVRYPETVSALCYSLIREHGGGGHSPHHAAVIAFVLAQHGRMPDYLRLPILVATMALDVSGLLAGGRPFHRLAPERRERALRTWRALPLGACRDLLRFYEALVVFGWTSLATTGAFGGVGPSRS